MKFSIKMILAVIFYVIISQVVLNFYWTEYLTNQTMILILTTNLAALTLVIVAYYKTESDLEKAKTKVMDELGLEEEDIEIYKTKFLPLLRKLKDVDVDRTIRIIEFGIKKFRKIDIDGLEDNDWGIDDEPESELFDHPRQEQIK